MSLRGDKQVKCKKQTSHISLLCDDILVKFSSVIHSFGLSFLITGVNILTDISIDEQQIQARVIKNVVSRGWWSTQTLLNFLLRANNFN